MAAQGLSLANAPEPGGSSRPIRNLTRGSIPRNLWWLAWPRMVEEGLSAIDQAIDAIWAGVLGISTLAGVGIAQVYKNLAMTGRGGLDISLRAHVSRAIGANDLPLANHVTLQGFTLTALFSLLMILLGVFFAVPLLRLLGVGEDVVSATAGYLRLELIGIAGIGLRNNSGAALQASGDAVTPMKAAMLTRAVHVSLTPFLIFGWWWFPHLGIVGASLANLLAQMLGASWNLKVLFAGTSRLHLTLRGYHLDPPRLWSLTRMGMPAGITRLERNFVRLIIVGLAAPFGTLALAAITLSRRAESIVHAVSGGLGDASGTLVGQNLGASNPGRARTTALWAIGYAGMLGLASVALLFVFAPTFVRLFTRDPEVVAFGATWLRIEAVGYLALNISQVFVGSFNTAGDTVAPMIVTLVTTLAVQVPLALMLTGASSTLSVGPLSATLPAVAHLGALGIAWAASLALMLRVAMFVPYFLWGRWLRARVG